MGAVLGQLNSDSSSTMTAIHGVSYWVSYCCNRSEQSEDSSEHAAVPSRNSYFSLSDAKSFFYCTPFICSCLIPKETLEAIESDRYRARWMDTDVNESR